MDSETENLSTNHEVDVQLLKYIFEPEDERLPELTDIPLNQVNPLSWMVTFEEALEILAGNIEYVTKKKANGHISPQNSDRVLLSSIWRKSFYKHRRSLDGSGKMMASTLAMKQLETQEPTGDMEDQFLKRA